MKLYDARIDIIFKKNKFKIIIVPPIKGIFSYEFFFFYLGYHRD